MDKYENIKTKEYYDKLLSSGMFWEFHPELTGNWYLDEPIIKMEQQNKHTTGEWMYFFNGNYFEVRGTEKATPNISIFDVSMKDHPNFVHYCERDETEANAKLIAASPNLLEACQAMIKAFKDAPKEWLMTNDVQQAKSIMMDAINKAVSDK